MTTQQPEALRLADEFDADFAQWRISNDTCRKAAIELRRQHARIAELEAQLSSSGFTAADMATASAQGFRDGVASVAASAGSEPVAWQYRSVRNKGMWFDCTEERAKRRAAHPETWEVRYLYPHPSPSEGMVGWLQVYLCKIKSKKRIDREIPRELQGWWADVAAGQKILLRQAVQSDLDRCNIGGKRSRNPADYMCETHTGGSLVSKAALEYMNPEENVFAATPTTSAGSGKGE